MTSPPFAQWGSTLSANREIAKSWDFVVAGWPVAEVRELARREVLAAAASASERLDGEPTGAADPSAPLVMTGHQPLLQHPGVWTKVLLAERLARQVHGTAVECIVDSDAFDRVAMIAPCADLQVGRCDLELVVAGREGVYFAAAPPPTAETLIAFEREGAAVLGTLGEPAVVERFHDFCRHLHDSTGVRNAAEAITAARRSWERPLGLDYRALPVTVESGTRAFAAFVSEVAMRAADFRDVYNDALAEYRRERRVRSAVRPFPDMGADSQGVEVPFWHLDGTTRAPVWARASEGMVDLYARGRRLLGISADDGGAAVAALSDVLAPRAVALTLFNRVLVADLFVHGAGGSAYDAVTDQVIRRFWGVEPPGYAAATLTMRLPIAIPESPDARIAEIRQELHALDHNPDRFAGDSGNAPTADRVSSLVREKAALVEDIARPGADKKRVGLRIRQVNSELAEILAPRAEALRDELAGLEAAGEYRAVLADRTYPAFLWPFADVLDALP